MTESILRTDLGDRLDAFQLCVVSPGAKHPLFISPSLAPVAEFDLDEAMALAAGAQANGYLFPAPNTLLHPITAAESLIGFMILSFKKRPAKTTLRRFEQALQNKLDGIPAVLDRLARLDQIERQNHATRLAFDTGSKLLLLHNTRQVAEYAVQLAVEELKFDAAALAGEDFRYRQWNLSQDQDLRIQWALGHRQDSVLAASLASGHIMTLDRESLSDLFKGTDSFEWGCVAPLLSYGERADVLLLFKTSEAEFQTGIFSDEAIRIFAEQTAHALDHARLYSRIELMAETDALTGLYNRLHFERALRREIARMRRDRLPVSLLMVDICDFKRINDTYGHLAGDGILRTVARLLEKSIRETDIVARYGGDEFVVLMPNTTEKQARLVQRRIQRGTERANENAAPAERFELSMGLKSELEFSPDTLIHGADKAMYQEKGTQARRRMIELLASENEKDLEVFDKAVASLVKILREKEAFYFPHAVNVMHLATRIGQEMSMSQMELENLALAALLHDVGKVAIQTSILNKSTPLSEEEYEIIKSHTVFGDDILSGVNRLGEVRPIIRAHHERWDGVTDGRWPGYPDGLSGEHIPLESRIIKLADMYDALTADRPYHPAQSREDALAEIQRERGKSLDPNVVDIFLKQEAE